jgi:thiol-disulfide isomerase/thioredoxin
MRRPVLGAVLAATVAVLTACSGSHVPSYDPNKTLTVSSPDLVALKEKSDVPNCPQVDGTAASSGMPSVTLSCLGGGRPVDVARLRGPMIVNLWASWCGSCKDEMPALAAYAKSQSAVQVLGVDFLDPHPDLALRLATTSKVAYPLVSDPSGALDSADPLPHISAMPTTVFLDAQGAIAHVEVKAYDSEQDVAAAARKYLGTGG